MENDPPLSRALSIGDAWLIGEWPIGEWPIGTWLDVPMGRIARPRRLFPSTWPRSDTLSGLWDDL